jgi:hypothetical protein
MSTISKIAVYDPRLQQDEPAYAVQKGALSVSVAPFQAISANSSQMTFQVLVPSLNVFVDRKLQLSATLNFTAQLFYGGPRSLSLKTYVQVSGGTTGITGNTLTLGTSTPLSVGTRLFGSTIKPGTFIIAVVSGTSYTVNLNQQTAVPVTITCELPLNYDGPEPSTGIQQGQDIGFMNANGDETYMQLGYCTAVSAKDLSYCSFPLQSALTNMTATLNDCTVTTNGDTLREQLLLTMTPENIKQRTTPTNIDTFAWGRDDVFNGSGNFSSYSVVNALGDIPNGAYPTTWFSDITQAAPLASVAATPIKVGTTTSFPFLALPTTGANLVGSFGLEANTGGYAAGSAGVGWYIATASTEISGATPLYPQVIVPFVNNQPVWTTGFPGGDLVCSGNALTTDAAFSVVAGATPTLTLLKDVPPYCMIAARLYTINTGAAGTAPPVLGWLSSLLSGSLGQTGSTYSIVASTAFAATTTLCLSAGWQVQNGPMPVYGAVSVVEPLVISPLVWADSAEFQTVGLYGMTNMQFVLNFSTLGTVFAALNAGASISVAARSTPPYWVDDMTRPTTNTGNILRSSNVRTVISDLKFGQSSNQYGPWGKPTLYCGFLTPGPDITLPLVSTVPYVEFPRYVKTDSWSGFSGSQTVSTNTISLTSIPDMIMVYVKPATKGPSQLDTYIPIQNIAVTFDNFSNLCSGFQQFNLYESAVAAGMPMDWHQWRGYTQAAYPSVARVTANNKALTEVATYRQTGATQLSGGPILLRMGHDITLSPGLAPGCLGNYSIQINMQTSNPYGYFDSITSTTVTLVAINTGFFETVRGQSAIRKTILNSADVEAATPEEGVTKTHLNRMVGRGNFLSGASTAVMKGLSLANKANDLNKKYNLSGMAEKAGIPGAAMAGRALSYAPQAQQMAGQFMGGSGKRPRSGLV